LFLGPSGVGKTWLSKQLAKFMFGDEESLLVFDMSDYMEKHNASRLVGSPPGYVGYDEGGQLTEKVRRRPYSVILLDEVEKAHPDVFNMLLQIMEEGRLVDSLGRKVDFRNSIIIMTSNIGAHLIREGGGVGFTVSDEQTAERIEAGIMEEVNRFFRPEFLNRLDEIISFNALGKSDLYRIIDLELAKVERRIASKQLVLHLSDKARDFLIDKGNHPESGARPLRRTIERYVEDALAEELLKGNLPPGSLVEMTWEEGEKTLGFSAILPKEPSKDDSKAENPTASES
jgi:ATP-dependent Clp protease ATP-binding subunit ClpC